MDCHPVTIVVAYQPQLHSTSVRLCGVYVCVCVCVCVHDTSEYDGNTSDESDIGHCPMPVKVME